MQRWILSWKPLERKRKRKKGTFLQLLEKQGFLYQNNSFSSTYGMLRENVLYWKRRLRHMFSKLFFPVEPALFSRSGQGLPRPLSFPLFLSPPFLSATLFLITSPPSSIPPLLLRPQLRKEREAGRQRSRERLDFCRKKGRELFGDYSLNRDKQCEGFGM